MIKGIEMNKSLIKVNGVNAYFCDIEFITGLYINGVKRANFPRSIHSLVSQVRIKHNAYSQKKIKFRKQINLLMLNIGNMYNCVDEVYGLIRTSGGLILPEEFGEDFGEIIEGGTYSDDNKLIKHIPDKFIIKGKYTPPSEFLIWMAECEHEIYFEIIKVKPQAIAYLKQKLEKKYLRRFNKIIRLFEMMGGQKVEGIDFDDYIDGWAKRLIKENFINK